MRCDGVFALGGIGPDGGGGNGTSPKKPPPGDGGAPGVFKYPTFTRPNFLSAQPVGVTTKFLYDYDINTVLSAPLTPIPDSTNVWDTGTWDDAVWETAVLGNQTVTRGAVGAGRTVAVAIRGLARTRTTLLSTDVMYIRAGPF